MATAKDSMEKKSGRPRSEQARSAVLWAVDDLLLEIGYAAMTMKNIAERAGVSRQTVYRWWSAKAEILHEASVQDARKELAVPFTGDAERDVAAYVGALAGFLAHSPAGAAYRALLGEAQHDPAVASLLATTDPLWDSASIVIEGVVGPDRLPDALDRAAAVLIGPTFYWILSGRDPAHLAPDAMARVFLRDLLELDGVRTDSV